MLSDYLLKAKNEKRAIGHFNFTTADVLRAVAESVKELNVPVLVGTSEGERSFLGLKQAVHLIRSYRDEGLSIFLAADHTKSFEEAKKAVDGGYDYILIDGSELPFDDNVNLTRQVFEYAKNKSVSWRTEVLVEGELGYLKGKSEIQEKIKISRDDFTKPEEAREFVTKTGVDALAIVFGNIHGIVAGQKEKLDFETLKKINQAIPETFLVLHGGSGLNDDDIRESIKNGIVNVHINTEIRVAYQNALAAYLKENPKETTPYKYLEPAMQAAKRVVRQKLELFSSPIEVKPL